MEQPAITYLYPIIFKIIIAINLDKTSIEFLLNQIKSKTVIAIAIERRSRNKVPVLWTHRSRSKLGFAGLWLWWRPDWPPRSWHQPQSAPIALIAADDLPQQSRDQLRFLCAWQHFIVHGGEAKGSWSFWKEVFGFCGKREKEFLIGEGTVASSAKGLIRPDDGGRIWFKIIWLI